MVLTPLSVLVGLNEPQAALPQVTVQLTPALAESFSTVAEMPAMPFTARFCKGEDIETEIAGGGVVVMVGLELLQATSAAIMPRLMRRRIDLQNVFLREIILREVIVHLRWFRPAMRKLEAEIHA